MQAAFVSPASFTIMAKKKKPQRDMGSEQAPPRITSNVKQNLRLLRFWKTYQKQKSGTPKRASGYRKKKVVKEQLPQDRDLYEDPTMNLDCTNQGLDTVVPVLLVDGYNVCGYWPKLKNDFMEGRLDVARRNLIDALITFSVVQELKVVVVFDAMFSGRPTHKETFAGIDIVFSADTSADAWIEKEVAVLKDDGCPSVGVATSDLYQQRAVYGSGAYVWSCKTLISEIEASQEEYKEILREQRLTSMQGELQGELLQYNLPSKVVDALQALKRKLSESESS